MSAWLSRSSEGSRARAVWLFAATLCLGHALFILAETGVAAIGATSYSPKFVYWQTVFSPDSPLLLPSSYDLAGICEWVCENNVTIILGTVLADLVLACACFLAWRGPRPGGRDFATLLAGGILLRAAAAGIHLLAVGYIFAAFRDPPWIVRTRFGHVFDVVVHELLLSIPAIAVMLIPAGLLATIRQLWRYRVRLGVSLIAAVSILAVSVGVYSYRVYQQVQRGPADLELALQQLHAAGSPTTIEDLSQLCLLPDGVVDSTDKWLQGEKLQDDFCINSTASYGGFLTPQAPGVAWPFREEAKQAMEHYRPVLASLHEAAREHGKVQIDIDFDQGIEVELEAPHLIGSCVLALGWEAYDFAREGESEAAANSILAMLRATEALEYEPFLLSQGYRMIGTMHSVHVLGDLLPSLELSAYRKRALVEQLRSSSDYGAGVVRAHRGERAFLIALLWDPALSNSTYDVPASDMAFLLKTMAAGEHGLAKPWLDGRAELRATNARVESLRRSIAGRFVNIASRLMLPDYEEVGRMAPKALAYNRVGQVAIALDDYFRALNDLPDTLEQLVPQFLETIPLDPMDGKPLKFWRRDRTCSVYSIGSDEIDDGGNTTNVGWDDADWGIVLQFAE